MPKKRKGRGRGSHDVRIRNNLLKNSEARSSGAIENTLVSGGEQAETPLVSSVEDEDLESPVHNPYPVSTTVQDPLSLVAEFRNFIDVPAGENYTRNEWRRCKTTLETSGEDVKTTLEMSGEDVGSGGAGGLPGIGMQADNSRNQLLQMSQV